MKKIISISILMLLFMGCSNDNAFEGLSADSDKDAVIEDAAIALDSQDYDKVISLLAEVYDTMNPDPDPDVSRLMGSAYMGKAGLDVINLISFTQNISYGIDDFDTVANTFSLYLVIQPEVDTDEAICNIEGLTVLTSSGGAQYIDGHCVGGLINYLDQAKLAFKNLKNANIAAPDDAIQLGIISAAHFVLFTGSAVSVALHPWDPDTVGYDAADIPVPITKQAYVNYRATENVSRRNWELGIKPGIFAAEADEESSLTPYQEDMVNVYNAIEAFYLSFSEDNDVAGQLEYFLRDIVQMQSLELSEGAIIATMTTGGIFSYIDVLSAE